MARSLSAKDVARSTRRIRASVRGKVHKSVLVRVNNICTLIEQVLPRADQLGAGSEEMHVLTRMATDYLPGAIDPYLALPRAYAERMPLSDGRTAIQALCAQLDVMYAQMGQVVDAVMRSDGDRLLANGRFLEDKFGQNPLNLPPDPKPHSQPESPAPVPPLSQHIVQAITQLVTERMRSRKKP